MVKLMAVVFVVLAICQIQALPTNGNGVEIEFSEDSNIGPPQFAPPQVTNREQKIEFLQDNEAQNLEEALFTYTQLLMNEKPGIQPFQEDNLADEQSTALCSERACDCSIVKIGDFQGIRRDTGEPCLFAAVPHCEGVCAGIHRYFAVKDGPGAEPTSHESYQCCLSTATERQSLSAYCRRSNGSIYVVTQQYTVPTGCACSSSSRCSRR